MCAARNAGHLSTVPPQIYGGEACGALPTPSAQNAADVLGTVRFKPPLLSDEIGRRAFGNELINTRGERNTDQFSPSTPTID
eukprot:1131280-Prymnesium_polylepis.2